MIHIKKACALTAVCAAFLSMQMYTLDAKADSRKLPDLREIVEANNFIAYCDLYDNIYMDYESEKDSCKAFYTDESGSSFYIKYDEKGDYEVVTSDYAVSSNGADGEDLTDLPVLLDDTLAVEQPEAVGGLKIILTDGFGIEEMGELFLSHTLTGVLDGNLHAVRKFRSGDCHPAVATGKLTGIVGHRVQHEEGEHLVGFHHCLRWFYRQVHAFHLERRTTLGEDVEEMLQTEALDMQAEVSLAQLDPVGEHIVIGIDLVGEFTDVFEPLLTPLALQTAGLVDDTVDERRNAVDE